MSLTDRIAGLVTGVAIKAPCRIATTANITLSGLQTIDGVSLVDGDRVLVRSQSDTTANGIYMADGGSWSRPPDFDGSGDFVRGTIVAVISGTLYSGTVWQLTTASPAIGSALAFTIMGTGALSGVSAYIQTLLPALSAAIARTTLGVYSTAEVDTAVAALITKALVTTKGDLVTATASATPARLAAGADGSVLMARSAAATGLTYASPFKGTITGLTYANNVADATNDIDIAAGGCMDATGAYWITLAALTKRLDAAWAVGTAAGGLDTGSIGNSDYYIWAIARSDTGVTDVIYSLSAASPTMPTGYDFKRLIGWFKRVSAAIVAFKTWETAGGGLALRWTTPTLDVNLVSTLTTARRTDAVKVPLNFETDALVRVVMSDAAATFSAIVCSPAETDAAPSLTAAPLANILRDGGGSDACTELAVRTDSTGKIVARATLATVDLYAVETLGFNWSRR